MRAGHKFSRRSVTYSSMGAAPAVRCCLSICLLLYTWICLSADAMYGCEPQHGTGIACSRFELSMSQVSLRLYSCHTAHGRNRPLRLSSRLSSMLLLVLAGDVEINPGPRRCKYPCGLCNLAVKKTDPAVCCDSCDTWIHNGCSGLSHNMYEVLKNTSCSWICPQCGMPSFSSSFWSSNSFSTSNSFSCLSDIGDDTAINDCGPVLASSPVKQAKRSILKIRGLKIMSVNVNGLRSKKTGYLRTVGYG